MASTDLTNPERHHDNTLRTAVGSTVAMSRRRLLLQRLPAFGGFSARALESIASAMQEERHEAGAVLVRQGDPGDAVFLLAEGRAEVLAAGSRSPVAVASLAEGELFGELALLAPDGLRQATVVAETPVVLLRLSADDFHALLDEHPEARHAFEAGRDDMEKARFLKLTASPFASLDAARFHHLVECLEPARALAGQAILRQGEPGDRCYLLRSGRVEVVLEQPDGTERQLATMGPGALLGESALLTNAPRNATVRA
ncbi:MAG: cyclic nucleotide-binding domain-containing protein, partial [Chloroflexi bacterium]|nr:cyclic nucleotide-binding domain-containing protein [Chloroflexota bacterium]